LGKAVSEFSDNNLVSESVKEPTRAKEGDVFDELECDEDFEKLWSAHPRPRNRDRSWQAWQMLREAGVASAVMIQQAQQYRIASRKIGQQYRCPSDLWLEERRWETFGQKASAQAPASASAAGHPTNGPEFWAAKITQGGYVPPSAISQGLAREMVSAGLVSTDQLRGVGVYL
jgi:hypothetical protein